MQHTIRNRYTRDLHSPQAPLAGVYARNHTFAPQFENDDDAGGGGGGGNDDDAGGGGDDAARAAADKPMEFAADKMDKLSFKFPGMEKAVSAKDLISALGARDQHAAGMKVMGQIAEALKKQQPQQQQRQQQQQEHPKRRAADKQTDAFGQLEGMELPEGKQLAAVLRQMYGQQIEPYLKVIPLLAKKIKEMEGGIGSLTGDKAETQFSGDLSAAVAALKLPQAGGKPVAGQDIVQEMARDFFFSFDDADHGKLRGETFNKMFTERFNSQRKFFRELEKATLTAAQERQRKQLFARPGANTSGSGAPVKLDRKAQIRQAANILFAQPQGT